MPKPLKPKLREKLRDMGFEIHEHEEWHGGWCAESPERDYEDFPELEIWCTRDYGLMVTASEFGVSAGLALRLAREAVGERRG